MWWTTLGVGTGLLAGFALSEWVGDVSRVRMRRAADRFRQPGPTRLTPAVAARAVEAALRAEPRLAGLPLETIALGRGAVKLRGWVPTRAARTLAGRVARAAPGIERIVNSILVRGEDDRTLSDAGHMTDQSA